MKRVAIPGLPEDTPRRLASFLAGAPCYDSSSSPEARVIYVDKDEGYFLKTSSKRSLKREAEMTEFFHGKGLGAELLCYVSEERDWLLSARVAGEDCTAEAYLADPKRLCDLLGERLRMLHETDGNGCPCQDRTAEYFETAERNYRKGQYDLSYFRDFFHENTSATVEDAWRTVEQGRSLLKSDTLLHGDYCLPNVVFDRWCFRGFIDVGNGGMGDRHVDLYWGLWSLAFNLKTTRFGDRFLDAYGRESVDPDLLRIVSAAEVFG